MPNSRLRPEIYVFQHVNAVLGKSCLSHAFHASPKLNATVFGAVRSLNPFSFKTTISDCIYNALSKKARLLKNPFPKLFATISNIQARL